MHSFRSRDFYKHVKNPKERRQAPYKIQNTMYVEARDLTVSCLQSMTTNYNVRLEISDLSKDEAEEMFQRLDITFDAIQAKFPRFVEQITLSKLEVNPVKTRRTEKD